MRRTTLPLNTYYLFSPLFVCLLLLTHHTWYGPDVWYHLTWGRDLLERGSILPVQRSLFEQPIPANLYWVFQTVIYGIYWLSGAFGVSVLFSALWTGIALSWLKLSGLNKKPLLGLPVFAAFIICAQLRFDQRPEVFAYLLILLILFILQRIDFRTRLNWRPLVTLLIIQTILTNTHGYFALGPLLGGAFVVSKLMCRCSVRERLRYAVIPIVLILGTVLSPNGLTSWEIVAAYEKLGRAMADVNSELFPTWRIGLVFPIIVFWAIWVVLFLLLMKAIWKRTDVFAILTASAGLYLSASMLRNIPLGLILCAPLLRLNFLTSSSSQPPRSAKSIYFVYTMSTLVFAIVIVTGDYHRWTMSLATFGTRLERASYPIEAVEFLNRINFKGRLFTDSYDGGYVEFMRPDLRIAGDSYFLDPQVTTRFFEAIKDPAALFAADTEFGFDGLLINIENRDVLSLLWRSPAWIVAHADSHRVVFLKAGLGKQISMSSAKYYYGDDLRRWTYSFSPITWTQLALQFNEKGLARKLLEDLRAADQVPSTAIRGGLMIAAMTKDRSLFELARGLVPMSFVTDPSDPEAIAKLLR